MRRGFGSFRPRSDKTLTTTSLMTSKHILGGRQREGMLNLSSFWPPSFSSQITQLNVLLAFLMLTGRRIYCLVVSPPSLSPISHGFMGESRAEDLRRIGSTAKVSGSTELRELTSTRENAQKATAVKGTARRGERNGCELRKGSVKYETSTK